jgi:Holliday junction resolvase
MDSREKGKRGERQWRDELRANGYDARRGQQFNGSPDSPDVICDALAWLHFEVKCVERLNIEDAMAQARRDAGVKTPVVAHKRNHRRWLVTLDAEDFFKFLRGTLPPESVAAHVAHGCTPKTANQNNSNETEGQ